MWANIDKENNSEIPFEKVLTESMVKNVNSIDKEKIFWIPMTVPVKQGCKLVVYHCDIKTNK